MAGVYRERGSAIVVGGGLVGALAACVLADRGYNVKLYEKRPDIRKETTVRGRSINLALSHRGRKALKLVGIEGDVLKTAVPMAGRFLHKPNGTNESVPYDPVSNQCIYSVGRTFLNCLLLDVVESRSNVKLVFKHALTKVNLYKNSLTLTCLDTRTIIEESADFIIGADGAFSVLRAHLQKMPRFDFSQRFIDHGYIELSIPPERGHLLERNHLHIWPRNQFMMIALPNRNGSWTVTLFMPFEKFTSIDTSEKLQVFFKTTFPDAVSLIGKEELNALYFSSHPNPLVSIKCGRYHMKDRFLIIGDAAHAMVPFYGQGMNAGFEDCSILNEILTLTGDDVPRAIELFTERRRKDAFAICDLALYNYEEMRDLVTKPTFKLRKMLDRCLEKAFPGVWVPLYNSVSFTHMRYAECVRNKRWQDRVLLIGYAVVSIVIGSVILSATI